MNFDSHARWEAYFARKRVQQKQWTQTKAPPNGDLQFLKNVKIAAILTFHL